MAGLMHMPPNIAECNSRVPFHVSNEQFSPRPVVPTLVEAYVPTKPYDIDIFGNAGSFCHSNLSAMAGSSEDSSAASSVCYNPAMFCPPGYVNASPINPSDYAGTTSSWTNLFGAGHFGQGNQYSNHFSYGFPSMHHAAGLAAAGMTDLVSHRPSTCVELPQKLPSHHSSSSSRARMKATNEDKTINKKVNCLCDLFGHQVSATVLSLDSRNLFFLKYYISQYATCVNSLNFFSVRILIFLINWMMLDKK